MKLLKLLETAEPETKNLEKELRAIGKTHEFIVHASASRRKMGMKVIIDITPSNKMKNAPAFSDQDGWGKLQQKLWADIFKLLKNKGKVFVAKKYEDRESAKPLTNIDPLMITEPTHFAGPKVPKTVKKYDKPLTPSELHFWIE